MIINAVDRALNEEALLDTELTDRQQRELDYHRERAKEHQQILDTPFSWEVLTEPSQRWWNAYWAMYEYLLSCELTGKRLLVVGCGFGEDALRLAKLGAQVSAFDLSPDSIAIASELAKREGLSIDFGIMPAETMSYADASFDYIVARDILHHVDIPATMQEIVRVAKPNAMLVINEIYSHSITDKIRHSWLVEELIYPRMRRLIYGPGKPYITEDERKLTEIDIQQITRPLQAPVLEKHFYFLVTRIIPDRFDWVSKLDRLALRLLKPIAHILAGRVLFCAPIAKSA